MKTTWDYENFIKTKAQLGVNSGFEPNWMPDFLFDFQQHLCDWSIRKGRGAIFADCGLGKTPMQLVWAENVVRHTNKPVMIATPLAVGAQTVKEAEKFGVTAKRTRDGKMTDEACVLVTNYEQLHKYDPTRFGGMVCDESSAIKDFKSERKKDVTEFMRRLEYRLLCTATAAPNDYWELGTSSEALGFLGYRDMLTNFFKQIESSAKRFAKDGGYAQKFRFRGHAEEPFWAWVCSWARSLRRPSDLGFSDERFALPELIEKQIVVQTSHCRDGYLIPLPAGDMREEREERRESIVERCEKAAEVAAKKGPCVLWCELNPEGDMLTKMVPGAVQVKGSMSDEEKEEAFIGFASGDIQKLVTKPKIGAWGLNWQHCSNTVCFPSHSYEQYYQLVRRFYRFGQKNKVNVTSIVCEGEEGILKNLHRKQEQAGKMFESIVRHMGDAMHMQTRDCFPETEEVPSWLRTPTTC